MSWCRWSTDIDNKCSSDLYIYDHVDDYIQVHVAGRRRTNYAENPYPNLSWADVDEHDQDWIKKYIENGTKRDQWFDDHDEWEDLPEQYRGANYSFGYDDVASLIEFLVQARRNGINFPDYIYDYCHEAIENNLTQE